MIIKYIFISKNESIEKHKEHKEFFKKIFLDVKSDTFKINNYDYEFSYSTSYEFYDKKAFLLQIELQGRNAKVGEALSEVNRVITKGSHRSKYKIITAYDEISEYYCEKGYKELSKWERKLRELIYRILIKAYGIEWYTKTVNEEMRKVLKERSRKNDKALVENALQEFTIGDLENFLFTPYSEEDLDKLLTNGDFDEKNLANKSYSEIVSKLNDCRPKSLWERFFSDIIIKDLKVKISTIREDRNKIAHNKNFYYKDYENFNKRIKKMIKEIDKAIEGTSSKRFEVFLNQYENLSNTLRIIKDKFNEIYQVGSEAYRLGSAVNKFINSIK